MDQKTFLKAISIVGIIFIIACMVAAGMGRLDWFYFWFIAAAVAFYAFVVLPKLRNN
jgi:hypothetical protein